MPHYFLKLVGHSGETIWYFTNILINEETEIVLEMGKYIKTYEEALILKEIIEEKKKNCHYGKLYSLYEISYEEIMCIDIISVNMK